MLQQQPTTIIEAVRMHLQHEFNKRESGNSMTVEVVQVSPWWKGDMTSQYFGCAANAIKKVWGMDPYYVCEGGTMHTTSILVEHCNAPALNLPIGQSSDSAHLPKERIRISNIVKGKDVVEHLLINLGEENIKPEKQVDTNQK
eukprot:m.238430 g.238430  ORF g.238430 m.238430 type:complete len:143 (-) comp13930_c0_seq33:51-479(-)